MILSSKFADDVAYPTDCKGVGIRLIMPNGFDMEKYHKYSLGGSLMGGQLYTADIVGTTSKELDSGRPKILVKHISNIRISNVPKWLKNIE